MNLGENFGTTSRLYDPWIKSAFGLELQELQGNNRFWRVVRIVHDHGLDADNRTTCNVF